MKSAGRCLVVVGCCLTLLLALPASAVDKKQSKAADKFRDQGEDARKAVEDVRVEIAKTLESYEAVLAASDKKLNSAYKKFTSQIDKTEKGVNSGRKTLEKFEQSADQLFAMWEANLDSIATASIREASEARLAEARAKYQAMRENLATAKEAYEPLMASLNEQALLLSQDLSADTVAMLKSGAAADVRGNGENVLASLDRVLTDQRNQEEQVEEVLEDEEAAAEED